MGVEPSQRLLAWFATQNPFTPRARPGLIRLSDAPVPTPRGVPRHGRRGAAEAATVWDALARPGLLERQPRGRRPQEPYGASFVEPSQRLGATREALSGYAIRVPRVGQPRCSDVLDHSHELNAAAARRPITARYSRRLSSPGSLRGTTKEFRRHAHHSWPFRT